MKTQEIEKAFADIEDGIIRELIDTFRKNRAKKSGIEQWKIVQAIKQRQFQKRIRSAFKTAYKDLNDRFAELIKDEYELASIKEAFVNAVSDGDFRITSDKIEALIVQTINDLEKAESAVFRKVDSDYRTIIHRTEVALVDKELTYEQAVDQATKDFLRRGITCVEYSNGSQHSVSEYARMSLRTAMARARFTAEGEIRKRIGVHTVYAHFREAACPKCMQFLGRVMIDDVYSGGTREEARKGGYLLLSEAMEEGFLHPNCKDVILTYDPWLYKDHPEKDPAKRSATKAQMKMAEIEEQRELKLQRAENNAKKYKRMAKNQIDDADSSFFEARADEWTENAEDVMQESVDSANGLDDAIKTFEDAVRNKPYEWLVTFDKDGNMLFNRTSFLSDGVGGELSAEDEKNIYGTTASHNHPRGTTFSPEDLQFATKYALREERACHSDGVYRILAIDGREPTTHDRLFASDFQNATKQYVHDVTDDFYRRTGDARTANKMVDEFKRKWLSENAENYGWEYIEEWLEG